MSVPAAQVCRGVEAPQRTFTYALRSVLHSRRFVTAKRPARPLAEGLLKADWDMRDAAEGSETSSAVDMGSANVTTTAFFSQALGKASRAQRPHKTHRLISPPLWDAPP